MKREKTSAIFQKRGDKNGTNFFFEQHKKIQ